MYPPDKCKGHRAKALWHRRKAVKARKKAQTADKTWKYDHLGKYSDHSSLINSAEWHMMAAESELMVMVYEKKSLE
jgi:hypothetical protein